MLLRRATILLLLLCLCSGTAAARGSEVVPVDARLKAGFLYNFFSFVKWPGPDMEELVLGIVSSQAEAEVIEATVYGKKIKGGQQLYVISGRSFNEVSQADLVFVASTDPLTIRHIVEQAASLPVLLVGEQSAFVEAGGHLAIVRHGKNMELMVNLDQAEQKGFKISSKLLRLATPVSSPRAGQVP